VNVGQVEEVVHDLRALEGLVLDPVDDVEIHLLGRPERDGDEEERDDKGNALHVVSGVLL